MTDHFRTLLAAAALAACLGAGAGTFTLWSADVPLSSPTITAGNLDLVTADGGTLASAPSWSVATCAAGTEVSKATFTPIDPAAFRVWSGQTVQFTQAIESSTEGDNMAAKATVTWASPASFPEGAQALWTVTDAAGQQVTLTAADGTTATQLPVGQEGSFQTAVGDQTFELHLFVRMPDDLAMTATASTFGIGNVRVSLDQVRVPAPTK